MIIYCDQLSDERFQTYCEVCRQPYVVMTAHQISVRLTRGQSVICLPCGVAVMEEHYLNTGDNFLVPVKALNKQMIDAVRRAACLLLHISTNIPDEGEQ